MVSTFKIYKKLLRPAGGNFHTTMWLQKLWKRTRTWFSRRPQGPDDMSAAHEIPATLPSHLELAVDIWLEEDDVFDFTIYGLEAATLVLY